MLLAGSPLSWDTKYGAAVRARWAVPGPAWRTGMVAAAPQAQAGSAVLVWVDAAGRLTGPRLQRGQARDQAVLAAVLALTTATTAIPGNQQNEYFQRITGHR